MFIYFQAYNTDSTSTQPAGQRQDEKVGRSKYELIWRVQIAFFVKQYNEL